MHNNLILLILFRYDNNVLILKMMKHCFMNVYTWIVLVRMELYGNMFMLMLVVWHRFDMIVIGGVQHLIYIDNLEYVSCVFCQFVRLPDWCAQPAWLYPKTPSPIPQYLPISTHPPPAHPRAIIYHPPRFGSSYFLKYWNSGFLQIGHQSHHLVRHPRLQRTPLEAHRTGSMFCPSFIINYGTRVTLWSIMFRNVTLPGKTHTPYFCLKYRNSIFLQVHHQSHHLVRHPWLQSTPEHSRDQPLRY